VAALTTSSSGLAVLSVVVSSVLVLVLLLSAGVVFVVASSADVSTTICKKYNSPEIGGFRTNAMLPD